MEPFTVVTGIAAPMMMPNINTDAITPMAAGRSTSVDLGKLMFANWRYTLDGAEILRTPGHLSLNGPIRTRVVVERINRNADLPDARISCDQRRRAATAVRIEVQDQDGTGAGDQRRARRDDEPVEGAETLATIAARVMEPARQ